MKLSEPERSLPEDSASLMQRPEDDDGVKALPVKNGAKNQNKRKPPC